MHFDWDIRMKIYFFNFLKFQNGNSPDNLCSE